MMPVFDLSVLISTWMIASVFLVAGIYSLALYRKSAKNGILTAYLFLLCVNSFFLGYSIIANSENDPLWMDLALAAIHPITVSGFLLITLFSMRSFENQSNLPTKTVERLNGRNLIYKALLAFAVALVVFPVIVIAIIVSYNFQFSITGLVGKRSEAVYSGLILFLAFGFQLSTIGNKTKTGEKQNATLIFLIGTTVLACLTVISLLVIQQVLITEFTIITAGAACFFGRSLNLEPEKRKGALLVKLFSGSLLVSLPILVGLNLFSGYWILKSFIRDTSSEIDPLGTLFRVSQNLGGFLILTAGIMGFLLFLVIRKIVYPIKLIQQEVKRFDLGEMPQYSQLHTNDDFSELSDELNRLFRQAYEANETYTHQIRGQNSRIEQYRDQMRVIATTARIATSIHDLLPYLHEIVQLIAGELNVYHVAIFLIDNSGEYTVLQAASSEDGRNLLNRGYKLSVDEQTVVGYVSSTGRIRLVQGVDLDSAVVKNGELPRTKSEIALPLKVSGNIVGVLDVHSLQGSAFDTENQGTLRILADQIALSIDSARRLQDARIALQELSSLYSTETKRAWQDQLGQRVATYRYNRLSVEAVSEDTSGRQAPANKTGHQLEIPISLRGQSLGSLVLRREEDEPGWTDEDLALAVDAVGQIVPALENARLLGEIEQRAQIERQLGVISSRIQGSMNIENVMRTTVEELSKVLSANKIRLRISDSTLEGSDEVGVTNLDAEKRDGELGNGSNAIDGNSVEDEQPNA